MCGISYFSSSDGFKPTCVDAVHATTVTFISNRGPDGFASVKMNEFGWLAASVLHIQGIQMTKQPYVDLHGNILLWNGEVFGAPAGFFGDFTQSDTLFVAQLLNCAAGSIEAECGSHEILDDIAHSIAQSLSELCGPYAFIYFHKKANAVFFGRDPFGRRSLLVWRSNSQLVAICSAGPNALDDSADTPDSDVSICTEVGITGIYHFVPGQPSRVEACTPWPASRIRLGRNLMMPANSGSTLLGFDTSSQLFLDALSLAVRIRVQRLSSSSITCARGATASLCHEDLDGVKPCRVGVLFSGGIDSVLLAALLHGALEPDEAIELVNVTFIDDLKEAADGRQNLSSPSPDRLAAIAALVELQDLFPSRLWRLVHVDVASSERQMHEEHIKTLIHPSDTHMDLNIGTAFWFAARGRGYVRSYSEADRQQAFAVTEAGRPLLRVGAEGAARSVGLCPHSVALRQPANAVARPSHGNDQQEEAFRLDAEDENALEKGADGDQEWSQGDAHLRRHRNKSMKVPCCNALCKRISKPGCMFGFCKHCCYRRVNEHNSEEPLRKIDDVKGSFVDLDEEDPKPSTKVGALHHSDGSLEAIINSFPVCPVHHHKNRGEQVAKQESPQVGSSVPAQAEKAKVMSLGIRPGSLATAHSPTASAGDTAINRTDLVLSKVDVGIFYATDDFKTDQLESQQTGDASGVSVNDDEKLLTGCIRGRLAAETPQQVVNKAICDVLAGERTIEVKPPAIALVTPSAAITASESGSTASAVARPGSSTCSDADYMCTCKALLVGIGADEQMAGYGRHRTAFLRGGLAELEAELAMDMERLWQRNLGRDDRCIGDHGREAWFPYLDEGVVGLLQGLSLADIADLTQSQGAGDKRILRDAARRVGLGPCSEFVKRAIQFGTRVAKLTNKQYHGSHRKGSGATKI